MNVNMNMVSSLPIIVYLAAALVITRIPFVGTYLSLCYTLLHEVVRALIGGRKRIRLIKHEEGEVIEKTSTLKHDLISYLSYTVASLAAIGLFYLVSIHRYEWILYLLSGLIAVALVCWLRHFLEFVWALTFIALLVTPIYFGYDLAIKPTAIFLGSYMLVQSVLTALSLCKESFATRKNKGIAAKVKWVPSMMLGLVLLGQTLYASYYVVGNFVL
ncbi:M50 family metallopeptidase [Neobacillus jeddahensis]|uniref:M50 family metallopeptidase n=1 Tax=Neobacillus jeddahensis TaxID=1461580 RepID=UPI00058FF373|nr:M50 family metallopeptidase [Neobacillus jeddahensis]